MVVLKVKSQPKAETPGQENGVSKDNAQADGKARVKIKAKSSANKIRIRRRHEPGLGYDSEASDREETPHIEEQCILRMKPGPDCDILRNAIQKREIGKDANVWIKFKDPRRAVVYINNHKYAAKLVDLPCIIESHKTFDKKSIFKSTDISQMLLVGDRIEQEDTVLALPLKPADLVYPHGITPPLRNVRTNRFRKRISNKTIETVEAEVDRLLSADARAESSSYELFDRSELDRESSLAASETSELDLLAPYRESTADSHPGEDEVEVEVERNEDGNLDDSLLAGQIEQSMMEFDKEQTRETSATGRSESPSDEEEQDEEEDRMEEDGEENDGQREMKQQQKLVRARIQELETTIEQKKRDAERAANPILRNRFLADIGKLNAEYELKLSQLEEQQ